MLWITFHIIIRARARESAPPRSDAFTARLDETSLKRPVSRPNLGPCLDASRVTDAALKKQGYDFIRKFDCWVFPKGHKPAEKDFHELVKNCVTAWYRTEYAKERDELEILESAGVRELKKHLF